MSKWFVPIKNVFHVNLCYNRITFFTTMYTFRSLIRFCTCTHSYFFFFSLPQVAQDRKSASFLCKNPKIILKNKKVTHLFLDKIEYNPILCQTAVNKTVKHDNLKRFYQHFPLTAKDLLKLFIRKLNKYGTAAYSNKEQTTKTGQKIKTVFLI